LDYLTKVLADLSSMLTIEWQPTVEDLKKIQELSNIVEEKGGRPYLAMLNSCQFDKINIDKNTLLAKIEDVGRSL